MENKLGESILKAAVVIGVAIVLAAIVIGKSQVRYSAIGSNSYIDQSTGNVYYLNGTLMNGKK